MKYNETYELLLPRYKLYTSYSYTKFVLLSAGRRSMRRRRRHRARILITSRFAMAAASPGRLFRDNNIKPPLLPPPPKTHTQTQVYTVTRTPRRQPSPKGIILSSSLRATSEIITISGVRREKYREK